MSLEISFNWITDSSLAIHTGIARAGGVDRVVRSRRDPDNPDREQPEIPGEVVKAVVRETAERILRWRGINNEDEDPDRSIPTHENLARLFAPQWCADSGSPRAARYFFDGSLGHPSGGATACELMEISATSIEGDSRTARHNSLRAVEVWKPDVCFGITVRGEGGEWTKNKPDREDLQLLLMAIVCADAVGGGWGVGRGELGVNNLVCKIDGGEIDIASEMESCWVCADAKPKD